MANITETYEKFAHHFPNKMAIQTHNQQLNYQDWYELINKTASWLDSFNTPNPTLGILMPNGIPFLQLFTGASMAGWTAVPFDIKWKEAELSKRLTLSLPTILITTREIFHHVNPLLPNVMIWEDCLNEINHSNLIHKRKSDENLPFYMGFTSGTTGEPKAFIRSHESWVASFACNRFDFLMDETDHVLIPGALIHSHFLYGAISTLYLGGTVYLLEKFSPTQGLSCIESNPITTIFVVPTMLEAFLKEGRTIESSIKILSSGAKWTEKSKQEIRNTFLNMTMFEFYGASEMSFISVLSDDENNQKAESVGKPCHGVEIQIRHPNNELAKPYNIGKIYVRSKLIFTGYIDGDKRAINPIQDANGWATVDDMGYFDEDGYLYIVGREKNMILYGAINIFPEEIEKVISLHPDVEEVAVVGVFDPYWGQITAAVVKGNVSKLDLKRVCKRHLASYKIPRKWYFLNEMPHTTSGKIARAQLVEQIESKVNSH
jgi:long-chain acyl-CoA synthetase